MSERKAGWYWVKLDGEWHASQYRPGHIRGGDGVEAPWSFGILLSMEEAEIEEIGPRISTPDEPWQTVPAEPTPEMMQAGYWSGSGDVSVNESWARREVWNRMLAAAPKAEDT